MHRNEGDPPLQLLIDVKSDANETHAALHTLLAEYEVIKAFTTDMRQGRRRTYA